MLKRIWRCMGNKERVCCLLFCRRAGGICWFLFCLACLFALSTQMST